MDFAMIFLSSYNPHYFNSRMSKYLFLAKLRARQAEIERERDDDDEDEAEERMRELYIKICHNNPQFINPPCNAYSLYDHRATFNELLVRFPTRERWRSQFRFDLE